MKAKHYTTFPLLFIIAVSFFLQQCNNEHSDSGATTKAEPTTIEEPETAEVSSVRDTTEETIDTSSTIIEKTAIVKEKPKSKVVNVPLSLIITNLASPTAPIMVGLYGTKNDFPNPKDQLKEYKFKPKGNQHTAKITGLKFGTYAIAIYQDENSDGKIGKNFMGIPTEGYAFSNNIKPTVKAPSFKDCKFEYTASSHTVNMTMLK